MNLLVRSPYEDQPSSHQPPRSPLIKHRILFLAANPVGTDRLALDEEARAVQVELERSGFRDSFELVTRWAAEPLDLLRELRKLKPAVVHFSGHGTAGTIGARGDSEGTHRDVVAENGSAESAHHGLYFQGAYGRPQLVSAGALAQVFEAAGASVKLVVLSACYSDAHAEALLTHVECVVGMRGSIRDDAAHNFAIGFYGGLGERESVAVAYRQGCAAIGLEGLPDGDTPQLRVHDGVDAEQVVLADSGRSTFWARSRSLASAHTSASAQAPTEPVQRIPTAEDANSDRADERTASGSSPTLCPDAKTNVGVPPARVTGSATELPRLRVPLFHYGGVVPPDYFIGRAEELDLAEQLIRSRQSFLLVGERRSGKTSFCEALIHRLMGRSGNDVLVSKLNLESCQNLTIATFLGHTLLNLIGEIARQVFGCHYSTLLLAKSAAKERLSQDPAFVSLLDLHRLVLERIRSGQDRVDSLLPQEFIAFCSELLDLIAKRGWHSCVMIYDEANHLAKDLSIDLLMNNMEVLSSAMIVTVYAASPAMAGSFDTLSAYLLRRVPIGPFKSHMEMRQLLARYYHNDPNRLGDLPITDDAQELTWKTSKGTPFRIQCLFAFAFGHARQREAHLITAEHIGKALADLKQEMPQYFNLF